MGYNPQANILVYLSMVKVIAEVGSVHDGSFGNAQRLIEEVAKAGAWGVKFQHHIADAESTSYAPNPAYFKLESRRDYFNRIGFDREQWKELYDHAKSLSLEFIVSPFSIKSLSELQATGIDIVKIASGEVTNTDLLREVKKSRLKTIISSGMSSIEELERASKILKGSLICMMQCTSEYPCKPENVGLNNIRKLSEISGSKPGFSDHTIGSVASILAVGKGAEYIEKHVTFSTKMYGSDARHSMELEEFENFVKDLQIAQKMEYSKQDKNASAKTLQSMKDTFEKSLVYAREMEIGSIIEKSDLALKKPGNGLPSEHMEDVIGRRLKRVVKYDEQVQMKDFNE